MRHRKNRRQREEVRRILHTMRLELAAQRLAQEKTGKNPAMHLAEVFSRLQAHR